RGSRRRGPRTGRGWLPCRRSVSASSERASRPLSFGVGVVARGSDEITGVAGAVRRVGDDSFVVEQPAHQALPRAELGPDTGVDRPQFFQVSLARYPHGGHDQDGQARVVFGDGEAAVIVGVAHCSPSGPEGVVSGCWAGGSGSAGAAPSPARVWIRSPASL